MVTGGGSNPPSQEKAGLVKSHNTQTGDLVSTLPLKQVLVEVLKDFDLLNLDLVFRLNNLSIKLVLLLLLLNLTYPINQVNKLKLTLLSN
ncbi:hypothetical protein F4782DRAFT_536576 [Xylaria castorea]|nr:hypothetical protein F4782DRAFT_536576 [Xylaria castorea]